MSLEGALTLPGDKSISHRALMLATLAGGVNRLRNLNPGRDVAATQAALKALGIEIRIDEEITEINGGGLHPFREPTHPLDCGNSGTTARMMMGLLAPEPFQVSLTGDESLRNRPMDRVIQPLRRMGVEILAREDCFLPLLMQGGELDGIDWHLPVPSAQVKSALLLAGLRAQGPTVLHVPGPSRDHTERCLRAMGVTQLKSRGDTLQITPATEPLEPLDCTIPGDFSTAAFFMAAAVLIPGSHIHLLEVSLNPTRIPFLRWLQALGADIVIESMSEDGPEPLGDLHCSFRELHTAPVPAEDVPLMMDELPLVAVVASQVAGETVVRGAGELRVKESDRIKAIVENLTNWGVEAEELPDGFRIVGPARLKGGPVKTYHDHRIAMAFTVAGLVAEKPAHLDDTQCVAVSHTDFFRQLRILQLP